ncbi:MAG TPA: hypothetical protein VNK47_09180 [Candidatus Dormibacteraeota bacterium]|nr:hypothetical protein [Candidatus Dormibacteraeota bacterium]
MKMPPAQTSPIPIQPEQHSPNNWKGRLGNSETVKLVALVGLFTLPALLFLRNFYMSDPDFGWHLRAGEWILSSHAVPYTDPFSVYGADKPWYDYSWLFDIGFALVYRAFGLAGLVLVEVAFRVAIPAFLFRMARKLELAFWPAAACTALAAYSISSIYAPRPGMFTIIFLAIELEVLLTASLTGKFSRVYWLIPLFAVWASIHIQFVHGLIVLALFAGEPLLNALLRYRPQSEALPAKSWWVVAASFLATLATPYGWHIYSTVFVYAGQKRIYETITEMLPMNFRQPFHFVLLLLAFAATCALGWSRSLRPAYLLLFAFAAVLGFRSIKDSWLLPVVSVALLAVSLRTNAADSDRTPASTMKNKLALVICVVAVLAVAWRRYDVTNAWIEMGLAGRYPEAAVRFIEKNRLKGPLYNDFTSGGFLIWRLPSIPVSIDGRTNVHGDDRVKAYSDALRGLPGWEKDPDLARANLIIWPAKSPLPALLRCDSRFTQVFADPQAVVFVRR